MTEKRRNIKCFMWNIFCLSSPGRGDFATGEEEDSIVGSTAASGLKVTVCCFVGVLANPTPWSVETNQKLFCSKGRHQLSNYFIYTCATLIKQISVLISSQHILITFSPVISDRFSGEHHRCSGKVEFNILVQS